MWQLQQRASIEADKSRLSDRQMYDIVARMCRFVLHEVVNEKGRCFVPTSEVAQHLSLCNWDGKPKSLQDVIRSNTEVEAKRQETQDRSWSSVNKDQSK